jgi:hypothetical protein
VGDGDHARSVELHRLAVLSEHAAQISRRRAVVRETREIRNARAPGLLETPVADQSK